MLFRHCSPPFAASNAVLFACVITSRESEAIQVDASLMLGDGGRREMPIRFRRKSRHFVADVADLLDPDLNDVAGLEIFAAPGPDASRRAGEDQIAGMQ